MAYIPVGTYNDRGLSVDDAALVQAYKTMYQNATTQAEKDAAHAAAEAVRAGYGYSGGGDGSDYILLQQEDEPRRRTEQAAPSYDLSGYLRQQQAAPSYDLSGYLRQQQAAQTEAEIARLTGAYETSMRGYDDTGSRLANPYNAARNSLAAQNDIAQRNFDERAVASGLSSGSADQALLSRQNAYVGGLAGIDEEQANAQAALDLQKANVTTEYETAIAVARNEGDATLANALYNELVRVQNLEREDAELAKSDAQRAQELALKYGLADPTTLYQIGGLEDLARIRTGGGTDDLSGIAYTGGNGLTGGTTGGSVIDNGGLTAAQIKEMQQYYGVTADGLWGKNSTAAAGGLGARAAWEKYQNAVRGNGADMTGITRDYPSTLPQYTGRSYDPARLSYSPDEGTFTWNGTIYGNTQKLLADIEAANLNNYQKQELARAFAAYGFDISL